MNNNYWGPEFSSDKIEKELNNYKISHKKSGSIEST